MKDIKLLSDIGKSCLYTIEQPFTPIRNAGCHIEVLILMQPAY